MRTCRICKQDKLLTEFHFNNKKHKSYKTYCKDCGRKARREYRKKLKDGKWYVYLLPEEHYVGITNCIKERMRSHKKITDGYEIIGSYETPAHALMVEAYYHTKGYYGCKYE